MTGGACPGLHLQEDAVESVVVEFKLPYRCEYGQHVLVVGSDGLLGGWDVGQAAEMKWTPGDIWTIKLELGRL